MGWSPGAAVAMRLSGAVVILTLPALWSLRGKWHQVRDNWLTIVLFGLFGVAAVTPDGQVFSAGDAQYAFAIESISKVFTLALVMDAIGPDAVRAKVGADPTGLPFNSVMALELHGGKPLSPLVNAGARPSQASFSSPPAVSSLIRSICTPYGLTKNS